MIVELKENLKYAVLNNLDKNILNTLKTFIIQLYQEELDKIILFGSRARADNRLSLLLMIKFLIIF
jgi:predicted nucleotidyltransferase